MHIRSNSNGQQNCLIIFSALVRINAAAVKKGEKNPKLIKNSGKCLHDHQIWCRFSGSCTVFVFVPSALCGKCSCVFILQMLPFLK